MNTVIDDGSGGDGGGGSSTGLLVGLIVVSILYALTIAAVVGFAVYRRKKYENRQCNGRPYRSCNYFSEQELFRAVDVVPVRLDGGQSELTKEQDIRH